MPPWITTFLAVAAGVATLAGMVVAVRQATPVVRNIIGVFNDLAGEAARPGVPARPGIVESLASIKATQQAHGVEMAEIRVEQQRQGVELEGVKHELHPNSGGSLRDAVDRLEKAGALRKGFARFFHAPRAAQ